MRKVVFFTGNRAEFGLQRPIIQEAIKRPDLDVSILVTGAHLDLDFGKTIEEIYETKMRISGQISLPKIPKDLNFTSRSIASVIEGVTKELEKAKPDLFVVYADRFEGFAALVASTQMNIPTAHIEGGDLTEGGALDDSIRHAMTKLAHLHFTTNEDSMRRVLRLGEEPWRVFNVGFPAIDLIMRGDYASKDEVATKLDIDFERPIVVFTQHSITIEPQMARQQMQQCIQAIRQLISMGIQVILTYPNNDDGSSEMIEEIEDLRKESQENIRINKSLGRYMYHGVLALSKLEEVRLVCAGNSSSGIKETPAFGCPTVNIGSRQSSRLRGENVIDAVCEAPDIFEKIKVGLFDEKFRATCKMTSNPYYLGGASRKIVEVLSTVELSKKLLRKKMTY